MPVMHLLAGPNGAGKTTFYECVLAPRFPALPFINAAIHAAEELRSVADPQERMKQARLWSEAEWASCIGAGRSFVTETNFSHASRLALIAHARSSGFEVVLYALAVDEPRLLLRRLTQQGHEGGCPVPTHKALDRYTRCIENLRRGVRLADLSLLLDATNAVDGGPRLCASVYGGKFLLHTVNRPRWLDEVIGIARN